MICVPRGQPELHVGDKGTAIDYFLTFVKDGDEFDFLLDPVFDDILFTFRRPDCSIF